MPGSVLIPVSYALLAVAAVVFLIRTLRMARMPAHLRWELAPVPHEKGRGHYGGSYFEQFEWWTKPREKSLSAEALYMFLEIVFLRGVWEHNRRLWWFSFPLHFGLYLLITAVGLLIAGVVCGLLPVADARWVGLRTAVLVLAAAGYLLGGFGAVGLLISRLVDARFKSTTSPASLFNLALLLAVFASGVWAVLAVDDFVARAGAFLTALGTAEVVPATSAVLALHLVFALFFLAYLPFSQMMHFVAKYFTYHHVRWDDQPLTPGGRLESEVTQLLKQPVTWSAPHLKADGKKNWVDLATEENDQ